MDLTRITDLDFPSGCGILGRCKSIHFCFKLNLLFCSGGEKKAPTISTEDEFERSKASILKKSGQCDIGIQFDLDMMDGYRIRKRVE
jgi:hypothetical protein